MCLQLHFVGERSNYFIYLQLISQIVHQLDITNITRFSHKAIKACGNLTKKGLLKCIIENEIKNVF